MLTTPSFTASTPLQDEQQVLLVTKRFHCIVELTFILAKYLARLGKPVNLAPHLSTLRKFGIAAASAQHDTRDSCKDM